MSLNQVKLHLFVGFLTFVFLTVVGLFNEVSFGASFYRALIGGIVFGLITCSLHNILKLTIFKDTQEEKEGVSANFDFKIDDDGIRGIDRGDKDQVRDLEAPPFKPFEAKQIDPQLNKKITDDPERAAELVRKMGLDE